MTVEEYNRCVDEWADNLYRFVLKSTKDEERTRDILQETFEKLWRKVSQVDSKKSKSYLFTTAYNTMIDEFRKDKKRGSFDEVQSSQLQITDEYSDLNELLHQGLQILPEIQRSVLLLRDYEGYNYEEIGEITNLNESQVKVYIFRARKALRKYIGKIDVVL